MSHPLEENLTAYIDGELAPADVAAMEAALQENAELRAMEAALRSAVAVSTRLSHPEPSAALKKSVMAQLEQTPTAPWWTPWLSPARLAPVFALAAAVVFLVTRASVEPVINEPDALALADQMEVLESMDVAGLDSPDDVELVAQLHELEVAP